MTKKKPFISDATAPDEETHANEQIALLTEALQRERADSINVRRRYEEQLARLNESTKAAVITKLLPVIDNFERSLRHVPADLKDSEYIKGIGGIVAQFEKTLESLGVERIAAVGQPFDPKYHEAVSMEDGEGSAEIVCEELQAGYRIGDDVIRHAMVRVKSV